MFRLATLALLFLGVFGAELDNNADELHRRIRRGYKSSKYDKEYEICVTNISFNQPFSPFFVAVHNRKAMPLYEFGEMASDQLAILAEDGNPQPLVELYEKSKGVKSAMPTEGPTFPGETICIPVKVNKYYQYVTFASMAINTNDCFVAEVGIRLKDGDEGFLPGLDAGSEENNELCESMPGPGCPAGSGNIRSGNGEGFVHVHRGFFGIGDLAADRYDWRNPMARYTVKKVRY